jgi:hypothetical protein
VLFAASLNTTVPDASDGETLALRVSGLPTLRGDEALIVVEAARPIEKLSTKTPFENP